MGIPTPGEAVDAGDERPVRVPQKAREVAGVAIAGGLDVEGVESVLELPPVVGCDDVRDAYREPFAHVRTIVMRVLWHVLEDQPEIAEADGGVDTFGHLGRLHARRPTSACSGVVQVDGGQGRAQTVPPSMLQRRDVVDPAVASVIEGHRSGDALVLEAGEQQVKDGVVGPSEKARGQAEDAEVVVPVL